MIAYESQSHSKIEDANRALETIDDENAPPLQSQLQSVIDRFQITSELPRLASLVHVAILKMSSNIIIAIGYQTRNHNRQSGKMSIDCSMASGDI